ncbi:MAG: CheR family methyltransferase, partial [Bdellovibrionota bacterium]
PEHPRFEILATDIADTALKRVREARYSQLEVQRGLGAQRMLSYFSKDGEDHWVLRDDIRRLVRVEKQNLLGSFAQLGLFHIVSCRYALIYQEQAKKKEIVQRLARSLYPGGYLVLGASESALGICPELEQVHLEGAILYRKK